MEKNMSGWKTIAAIGFAFTIAVLGGVVGWILATEPTQKDFVTNVLLSFCAGLLASIVFTLIIQSILSRQSTLELEEYQRITMSVNLYQDFHSLEMLEARCRVERLLKRLSGRRITINELHAELFMEASSPDNERDWIAFSGLLRFYERMDEIMSRKLLTRDVARKNYKFFFDWLMDHSAMQNILEYSREKQDGWLLLSTLVRLRREVFD